MILSLLVADRVPGAQLIVPFVEVIVVPAPTILVIIIPTILVAAIPIVLFPVVLILVALVSISVVIPLILFIPIALIVIFQVSLVVDIPVVLFIPVALVLVLLIALIRVGFLLVVRFGRASRFPNTPGFILLIFLVRLMALGTGFVVAPFFILLAIAFLAIAFLALAFLVVAVLVVAFLVLGFHFRVVQIILLFILVVLLVPFVLLDLIISLALVMIWFLIALWSLLPLRIVALRDILNFSSWSTTTAHPVAVTIHDQDIVGFRDDDLLFGRPDPAPVVVSGDVGVVDSFLCISCQLAIFLEGTFNTVFRDIPSGTS